MPRHSRFLFNAPGAELPNERKALEPANVLIVAIVHCLLQVRSLSSSPLSSVPSFDLALLPCPTLLSSLNPSPFLSLSLCLYLSLICASRAYAIISRCHYRPEYGASVALGGLPYDTSNTCNWSIRRRHLNLRELVFVPTSHAFLKFQLQQFGRSFFLFCFFKCSQAN